MTQTAVHTQPTPSMEQLGSHDCDFKHKELCQTCIKYMCLFSSYKRIQIPAFIVCLRMRSFL